MAQFIDAEKGRYKPISIALFMKVGEYDQGDTALIAYDDLYDLIHGHENKNNPPLPSKV